uniref:Fatty acid hydroxylase domain-containing protein n=1 Tax=Alexandrium monilatum TaxID=311494 RepID=A0A7S4TAH8_9DINO
MANQSRELAPYSHAYPEEALRFSEHFSSLLLSGHWGLTLLELGTLASVTAAAVCLPAERVNVPGSMPLRELSAFLWAKAAVARLYNTYCEALFFSCPPYRIQPSREHALKARKDLCGRQQKELDTIVLHDHLTLLSQFAFNVGLYYAVPGYYPAAGGCTAPWYERVLKVMANHYVMSFGMYWMHRALHVDPWLWDNIHSYHHWAKHPLSRNTYQDHWLDNLGNAVVGHFSAQVLVPLDHGSFWFSHLFRILESLEKHSGVSCYGNLAHSLQRWFPFAQMPHHHDWHHEGHKSCNYTFSSIGGLWDCIFGTRKAGRAGDLPPEHVTRYDTAHGMKPGREKAILDKPLLALAPVFGVGALVVAKLRSSGGVVRQ